MANKCESCCSNWTVFRIFILVGILFVFFGTILLISWPRVFQSILQNELTLTPQSRMVYSNWKVVPIPMYMEYYLFNWTNPDEIHDPSKKPNLVQLGPYVFREHRVKEVEGWYPENKTVTYKQNRTWYFEPEKSNGTLDDLVLTLNVPAITAAYSLRDMSSGFKAGLDIYFFTMRTKYFVKKTVREFLYEGYKDPILDLAHFKPGSAPFDKFGWVYARNGSVDYDGIYNMRTDASNLGLVKEWNYKNRTHFYASPCNNVAGYAGELFPPGRDKNPISIFSSDICRNLDLNFKEKSTVNGITSYRYWGDDLMFANKTSFPENWCYCGDDGTMCYPNGVLNVTACKWGAPAFISFPHFFHGDESYRSAVIGMKPDEKMHQFFIDIEPETGIPLQVSAGFQINILLQPDSHYSLLKKMPRIFFPMLWFRQTAHVDEAIAHQIKVVLMVSEIGTLLSYGLISIGLSLFVILLVIFITLRWRRDDEALYLVSQNQSSQPSS